MTKDSTQFFEEVYNFKDPVFKKALQYLYSCSVGAFQLESHEKTALDHFKSIEVIINALVNKDSVKKFATRVDQAAEIIDLSAEEVDKIKEFHKARSNNDIAHAQQIDFAGRYPNQFPLPTGLNYPWAHLDSIARVVLLKYFKFRKNLFLVNIEEARDDEDMDCLGTLNHHSECNRLMYWTDTKKNKNVIKSKLKSAFSREFSVTENKLDVEFAGSKEKAYVLNQDSSNIDTKKLSKGVTVIFGQI